MRQQHKVRIYQKYHMQCMSPRRNWDSPTPSLASECAPPPRTVCGGAHSPAGEGLEESQFRRLEKKLSTLPTLWTRGIPVEIFPDIQGRRTDTPSPHSPSSPSRTLENIKNNINNIVAAYIYYCIVRIVYGASLTV
jgi:hypothetical protein